MPMSQAVGIDVGGTNIKYGIAGADGSIVYEGLKDTGRPHVLQRLQEVIAECREEALSRGLVIEGIGVGVPAIMAAFFAVLWTKGFKAEDRELFRMRKADIEELKEVEMPAPGTTGDVAR